MASKSKGTEEVHLRFFTTEDKNNLEFIRKMAKKEKTSIAELMRRLLGVQVRFLK